MSEWQPIETAPKDGTPILVLNKGVNHPVVQIASWYDEELISIDSEDNIHPTLPGWYSSSTNEKFLLNLIFPTHWMPLPEMPDA